MNKINNILGAILVLIGMVTMYSCQDDASDYKPAEKVDSEQVYFPSTNTASIKLSSLETSFDIAVARVKTDNAITVPLTITGDTDLYNFPSSVNFKQGESTAVITLTYDPEEVGFDNFNDISISLNEDVTSVYGKSIYSFVIGMPAPWKSLGEAIYVDDFITIFFGAPNHKYKVEVQENELEPRLYRLVNPYGEAYPENDEGDWDDSQDWYLEINATDSTAVYIDMQEVGMDWGYGMFSFGSIAWLEMSKGMTLAEVKAAGLTGTLEKGIITFPAGKLLGKMADYDNGGMYAGNGSGAFLVALPGAVLTDYSIDVEYMGHFLAKNDSNYIAAEVTLGVDVNSAKVALVANDFPKSVLIDDIIDDLVEDINKNKIESINIYKSGVHVVSSIEEDGDYYIVAVSYDEEGEIQEVGYDSFKYIVGSEADKIIDLNTLSVRKDRIGLTKTPVN